MILAELKKSLEEERDRLVTDLKSIARPHPGVAGEWDTQFPKFEPTESGSHTSLEEEADEVEEYENRLAAEGSLETRLLAINRALERIAHGTFGKCATCSQPIPLERLRANPAAEHDMPHEKRIES